MSISKIRQLLYKTASILGDVQAVKRGRVKERLWNRIIGILIDRISRKFYK